MTTSPWLTVVGIGEDGFAGLAPASRTVIESAQVVIGGARQLALMGATASAATRVPWTTLNDTLAAILACRGLATVVLASGDPMHFGIGATLAGHVASGEMAVLPHPGAFSLAAARLGWPVQDVETLSVHGRPLAGLLAHLAPGARLLVLSEDGGTPAAAAALLAAHGYGASRLWVLEHLGGAAERIVSGVAAGWDQPRSADLNTLAVACALDAGAAPLPCVPGLPDEAFEHDGQLTKREVRAVTLAALAPWPGALLWDVGAGAGSIAIEWMRAARGAQAVAVERDPGRAEAIARNAHALGVPALEVRVGVAPACLDSLPPLPDAVFVGGGVSFPGLLERGWASLKPGGRLIANAVTVEAEARLFAFREIHGGDLVRLSVHRLKPLGGLSAWDALAPVTQYRGAKARRQP